MCIRFYLTATDNDLGQRRAIGAVALAMPVAQGGFLEPGDGP